MTPDRPTVGLTRYLVGGAVRDELLGRPAGDGDWVVTGATPEEMLDRGFRRVGHDFPVFLHPRSGEEYALARTERKTGTGHVGFECNSDPGVTLEEDLLRRDLTINAIARSADGTLIDPHGGRRDLRDRILRHVSPAFVEDPLRVLRCARFAAQLGRWDFAVAADTRGLLRAMADSGELGALTPERVWQELAKALVAPEPARFFDVLGDCGAARAVFPELDDAQWSRRAGRLGRVTPVLGERCAAWLVDAAAGVALVTRLRGPREVRDLTRLCFDLAPQRLLQLDAESLLGVVLRVDALRRRERLERALTVLTQLGDWTAADCTAVRQLLDRLAAIDVGALQARGLDGAQLGAALQAERIIVLQRALAATPG